MAIGLNHVQAGIFIGGAIHDVAQVVGAGYSISPKTGDVATYVKLLRVTMLLPVVFGIAFSMRGKAGSSTGKGPPVPLFLLAFAALVAINSVGWLSKPLVDGANILSRLVFGHGHRRAGHEDLVQGPGDGGLATGGVDDRRDDMDSRRRVDLDQAVRMSPGLAAARAAIAPLCRRPEAETLRPLAKAARLSPSARERVLVQAKQLLAALRAPGRAGWVDQFLREYSLSSEEGAALLGLAEAYLRVPDPSTRQRPDPRQALARRLARPPRRRGLGHGQRRDARPDHCPNR